MKNINKNNLLFIIALITLVIAVRLFLIGDGNTYSSYTPIGAICLFCGAHFNRKWWAFALPIAVLLLSDVIINGVIYEGKYGIIADGWYLTYGVMLSIVLIGSVFFKKISLKNITLGAVCSSVIFWLVMDFSVWMSSGINIVTGLPLTPDFAGLLQSYVQGIPFTQNFFIGTVAYSAVLFGVYEFAKQKFTALEVA